ncbi:MAG: serine hydrolase domain-containing protein [Fimbriimonadaceae bacterium]
MINAFVATVALQQITLLDPDEWLPQFKQVGATIVNVAHLKDGKLNASQTMGAPNDRVFQVGFLSRLPLILITFQLVESGKLDLKAPVSKYITSFELPKSNLTENHPLLVEHLLTGQGGNKQYKYDGALSKSSASSRLDILREFNFDYSPGTDTASSGPEIMVLQAVVEDITGKSISELAQERVFKPLEIKNSSFGDPINQQFVAPGEKFRFYYAQFSTQGMWSNASDLAKMYGAILTAFMGRKSIISQESAKMILSPVRDQKTYGLNRKEENGMYSIFLGGQCSGYSANSRLLPESGTGAIIVTNGDMAWQPISSALDKLLENVNHNQ